jgi:hypothetical protein
MADGPNGAANDARLAGAMYREFSKTLKMPLMMGMKHRTLDKCQGRQVR